MQHTIRYANILCVNVINTRFAYRQFWIIQKPDENLINDIANIWRTKDYLRLMQCHILVYIPYYFQVYYYLHLLYSISMLICIDNQKM
jgi:hypothetical protein